MADFFRNTIDTNFWAAVPFHFWSAVMFVLGTMVGSFLNVCIYRMPREESIVSPPSHCPKCKHSIPWYLNIPLFAWAYLGGKCAKCREPISIRYFLVELLTGIVFLSCWLFYGGLSPGLALVFSLFMVGLIVATFIDVEHLIIPDEITIGGMVAGFLLAPLVPQMLGETGRAAAMGKSLWGMGLGAGILYAVVRLGKLCFGKQKVDLQKETRVVFTDTDLHLPEERVPYEELFYRRSDTVVFDGRQIELADRCYSQAKVRLSPVQLQINQDTFQTDDVHHLEALTNRLTLPREAMGFGDVKFIGAIGAFLGPSAVIFTIMASSVIGSVIGIGLMLVRKREGSVPMPYGPFLALAAVVWVFGGEGFRSWWLQNMQTLKDVFQEIIR